jgi:hypothetical protein
VDVWFAILGLNLKNIISSAAVQIVSDVCNPIFRKYSHAVQNSDRLMYLCANLMYLQSQNGLVSVQN